MEQLNIDLPKAQEEAKAAEAAVSKSMEPLLLTKVRQKFNITGAISLLFGILFAVCFYKARIGMNALLFTAVMIGLLIYFMYQFDFPIKSTTKLYFMLCLLFGLSTSMTANETLQFFNTVAAIILLNISILHQLHEVKQWDFMKYLAKMFGMLFLGIASLAMPFIDGITYFKRGKVLKNEKIWNILLGVVIAIPLLICVTALLSSADILFGDVAGRLFQLFISPDIVGVVVMLLFGFLSCYLILCGAAAQTGRVEVRRIAKAEPSIANTILIAICLVYLLFCGVQIIYLFAGEWFSLPEGYTFAEYARRGFFELLAVAMINLILMLIFTIYFKENRMLRLLLIVMTACTYVMIFSAAYRMLLYIDAYHLTFLRLFVLLCLFIIALLLVGVMVSIYRKDFSLFRYLTSVIAVCYLAFSFARPDYWIAAYYVKQEAVIKSEDANYLVYNLSLDAAPVVLPLLTQENRFMVSELDELRELYYHKIEDQDKNRAFRDYNLSCEQAKSYIEKN
jgi:hypothetical protein